MANNRHWSRKDIWALKQLAYDRYTMARAAEALNRTVQAVRDKASELNIKFNGIRKYSKDEDRPVLSYNTDDPRSQQIQICSHKRCHLHNVCPAYENYLIKIQGTINALD